MRTEVGWGYVDVRTDVPLAFVTYAGMIYAWTPDGASLPETVEIVEYDGDEHVATARVPNASIAMLTMAAERLVRGYRERVRAMADRGPQGQLRMWE